MQKKIVKTKTGKALKIPAKKVVKFRMAKMCKDAVLGK